MSSQCSMMSSSALFTRCIAVRFQGATTVESYSRWCQVAHTCECHSDRWYGSLWPVADGFCWWGSEVEFWKVWGLIFQPDVDDLLARYACTLVQFFFFTKLKYTLGLPDWKVSRDILVALHWQNEHVVSSIAVIGRIGLSVDWMMISLQMFIWTWCCLCYIVGDAAL